MLMHSLHTRSFFAVPFLQYSFLHSLIIAQYITFSPIIRAYPGCSLSSKKNLSNFFLKQDNFNNMFVLRQTSKLFGQKLCRYNSNPSIVLETSHLQLRFQRFLDYLIALSFSNTGKEKAFDFRLSHDEPLGWQKQGDSGIKG